MLEDIKKEPKDKIILIITWFIFFNGVASLLMAVLSIFRIWASIFTAGAHGLIILIFQLIIALGLIVTSFYLRRMSRRAIYAFTAIIILAVAVFIYFFLAFLRGGLIDLRKILWLVEIIVQLLIVVYFWIIYKKFV